MTVAYPIRVYYDQSCPLCAREMRILKDFDRHERIELVDCSTNDFQDGLAQQAGYSAKDFMTLIHARDADGRWLKGVAVFEVVYAAAGIDAVARFWSNRRLRPLWDWLYPHVANNRMWLSTLGLTRIFGWYVTRAAHRAAAQSQVCNLNRERRERADHRQDCR
jgi:predicted DCC family thiol-disulfide oxidoreductase YuxK